MRQARTAAFQNDRSGGLPGLAVLIHRASEDFRVPTQAQPQPMKCLTRKIPFDFCSQPRVPPKKKGRTDHCQIKLMSYLWVIWFLYPRLSDVSRFSWIARIKQSIYICFRLSYFHFIHRAAHCARYKDLHTSIWCHLFRFYFFPATRALNSGLLSSFSSRRNRLQVDQEQVIGKMFKEDEIITRTIAQHRKWWSRFGCLSSSFFLSFFFWKGMSRAGNRSS